MEFQKNIVFGLILLGAAACGSSTPTASSGDSPAAPLAANGSVNIPVTTPIGTGDVSATLSTQEYQFLGKINALRAQNGVTALVVHSVLQKTAREHSAYMAEYGLTHDEPSPNLTSWDRIENAGGNFNSTGENIAWGNTDASSTFSQWAASSGHLANMISRNYQYIGISENDAYWTTDFAGK